MVEQLFCKQQVIGSNPIIGSIFYKNMRNCKFCKGEVEQPRIDILNSFFCSKCALNIKQVNRKGIMVYGHKTAGTIQIVSAESFKDYRKYAPYGRNTGHGSGIHRVSKTTSCM